MERGAAGLGGRQRKQGAAALCVRETSGERVVTVSIRKRPLLAFVILTFGIAWGLGACLALFPVQIAATFGPTSVSNPVFVVAVYAPSISALVLTAVTGGRRGLASLLARFLHWRVGLQWYAAALLGVPALSALATLLQAAVAGSTPKLAHWYDLFLLGPSGREIIQLARQDHSAWGVVGLAMVAIFLSDPGPLGEELGWRGIALPALLRMRSPWSAGLGLGVIWGVWHVPAFFIAGLPQNSFSLPLFLVTIVAYSIVMTWVFQGTGGSLLFAVLLHAMLNTYFDLTDMPLGAFSAGVLAVAALIVVVADRAMRVQPATGGENEAGAVACKGMNQLPREVTA